MSWQERTDKEQQVMIYSNRPPRELAGGAVKVIAGLPVKVWVGPSDKPTPDDVWEKMSDAEKNKLEERTMEFHGKTFKVFEFPYPKSLQEAQYTRFSNELIWPMFHSMDADSLTEPTKLANPTHRKNFDYQYNGDPDKDWELYKQFNELGNNAVQQLKKRGEVTDKDLLWVHDYQNTSVKGDIYSAHSPFPPKAFVEKMTVNGKPALSYDFLQNYVKEVASHPTITFQRPIDLKNFVETMELLDPKFRTLNPHAFKNGDAHLLPIGGHVPLKIFGKQVQAMNAPVGVVMEDELKGAQESKIDRTTFDPAGLDHMGVPYDRSKMKDGRVPIQAVLGDLLNTDEEHRIFLAVHRNDYTKSTLEKVYAAGNYMARHPEEKGKTHFVYFLQPTRPGVQGMDEYRKAVEDTARAFKNVWGDSITVVSEGLDHEDFRGLLRHPNVVAYLGTGRKDGHDMMVREAASVRADFPQGDPRAALAIVTTNGTGASDVVRGTKERPGAYILDSDDTNFLDTHTQLTEVITEVNKLAKTTRGKHDLAERYQAAAIGSQKYGLHFYKDQILKVATQHQSAKIA